MNSNLNVIFQRRSVRRYTERDDMDDALVRDLLEAAMAAPSACCTDPWEFIVVRSRETLNRLADILPNGQMLRQAPLGIIVCGSLERAHGGELSYMLQDCSAAIENLLLAARLLGLGACWLGVHPRPERITRISSLFDLPEHIVPISAIALGWPAEHPEPRTRYRDEYVHVESWT